MQLSDSVYENLKNDVFQAKYKPNKLIVEREIAEKYGVSKLTAGEALHRLSAEGHLTSYPRSGYMVTTLTNREREQLQRMRFAVESLVLEIICAEASDEAIATLYSLINNDFSENDSATTSNTAFHMSMAKLTDDKYAISLMETLLGSLSRVEQYVTPEERGKWQVHHNAIVDALVKRDAALAKEQLSKDLAQR